MDCRITKHHRAIGKLQYDENLPKIFWKGPHYTVASKVLVIFEGLFTANKTKTREHH